MRKTMLPLLPLAGLLLAGCTAPRAVSTKVLLAEMTDMRDLAEFPQPAYSCRQFSSYDRKSTTPDDSATWFANHDRGEYLRVEQHDGREEYVMMDADGPGAVVRIWSANPQGTLRVYLDHGETPVIEAPMAELLGGKVPGIPVPIAGTRSRGWNCYLPIPYAGHCKITSDQGDFYYHVNYRTYPRNAEVATFRPADLDELGDEIAAVAEQLAAPRSCGGPPPPWVHEQVTELVSRRLPENMRFEMGPTILHPGDNATLVALERHRPAALVALRFEVDAADMTRALRELLITMEFDGRRTVTCPLGDFFGATPGLNPYASLPLGMTELGELWCHWVMPFRRSARIAIENRGAQEVRIAHGAALDDYEWTSRSMYFHADWRIEFDLPTRPMRDWNYLTVDGQGVFAGAAFAIANPVRDWWGEGDEKIHVDGEAFPSHFGTGTEDYYGYAWCCNEPFEHAYHSQPRCDGPGNFGHTAVNRWHILDRIPFRRDFRFDMELWHWHAGCKVTASVVAYWYGRPGAASTTPAPAPADLRPVELEPYVPQRVAGALEGEELAVIRHTGQAGPQEIPGCSGDRHLWWREARPGDTLELGFPAPQAGRHRVFIRCVKARDYGIHRLAINGREVGQTIDLYQPHITFTEELLLGQFDLRAGQNRLTVEITGANQAAVEGYMFGLDYLRLEPTQ